MIASLLGILGGFILTMLGIIFAVHADTHNTLGILIAFAGLVSVLNFLPHYKEYKDEWGNGELTRNGELRRTNKYTI